MLYQIPPDLSKIPVWGCCVKVHDTSGSKLDMQARDGHWVGFDPESDGHRIYWPDTQAIGIERSVIFENSEASKRNSETSERNSAASQGDSEAPQMVEQPTEATSEILRLISDPLGDNFKTPPPQPRHSTCQCFESDYMRRLHTGEGTRDGCIPLNFVKEL
ncbi:hypothetical protein M404DRAFT_146019 [Pisolithus tinctorius Marx 270]|uniref:Retroviral polymerase SH3-like domain-containing protein n=1 Tax=Pisolithus tinctorius Marx 270 TaxID=870435 RepID=A0A0C3P722_PISTI|nr:hypothetical protein M404DRAFT_146019 [Pisolithus tinctorius Marx 270]